MGCEHMNFDAEAEPRTPEGCEECLAEGRLYVHLRKCVECGHVGCCDSSPGRHATEHYEQTGHPVMRSFQAGEGWLWCYIDEVVGFSTAAHH
jgi:CPA1 family monovalent cation:H+ antiporter